MARLAPVTPTLTPRPRPAPMPGTLLVTTSDASPRPGCVTEMTTAWTTATSWATAPSRPAGLTSGSAALAAASPSPSNATLTTTAGTSQVTVSF